MRKVSRPRTRDRDRNRSRPRRDLTRLETETKSRDSITARGFLDNRLKCCWPEVICCVYQPNELKREIKKKLGVIKRGPAKNLEVAHPGLTLESLLASSDEQLKRTILHT